MGLSSKLDPLRNGSFNLLAAWFVYRNSEMFPIPDAVWCWPVQSWLMKSKMKFPFPIARGFMGMALLAGAVLAGAQAPARFLGTITAISGNTDRKSVV